MEAVEKLNRITEATLAKIINSILKEKPEIVNVGIGGSPYRRIKRQRTFEINYIIGSSEEVSRGTLLLTKQRTPEQIFDELKPRIPHNYQTQDIEYCEGLYGRPALAYMPIVPNLELISH